MQNNWSAHQNIRNDLYRNTHLSERCGYTVTASVTSANYKDILILGQKMWLIDNIAHLLLLPTFQESHSKMNTFQLSSRNG